MQVVGRVSSTDNDECKAAYPKREPRAAMHLQAHPKREPRTCVCVCIPCTCKPIPNMSRVRPCSSKRPTGAQCMQSSRIRVGCH